MGYKAKVLLTGFPKLHAASKACGWPAKHRARGKQNYVPWKLSWKWAQS